MGARAPPVGRRNTLAATRYRPNPVPGPQGDPVPPPRRAYHAALMRLTATAATIALAVAVGCSADSGAVPSASSVPPNDMPACEEIYVDGAEISNDNFGLACVKGDDLISPRPARIECTDGRELLFNDLAWGFFGEGMQLTPDDDPSKMPVEAVDECLEPLPGVSTTAPGA